MKNLVRHRFNETNTTRLSSLPRFFAALIAVLVLVLGSSGAAAAHDVQTGSSPTNGATVETVPEEIEITMSNTPAVIGSQVLVLDEAGNDWATGDVSVLDTVATQGVRPGAPAGSYTVKWRLVSSDSHPIEGEFVFTATTASMATAGAAVGAGPVASVGPQPKAVQAPVQDESAVPWSVVGLAVVLLGLVVALVVAARRRLSKEN